MSKINTEDGDIVPLGQTLSKSEYPDLYKALQKSYGGVKMSKINTVDAITYMKFKVQAQTLIEHTIEAVDQEDAEQKMYSTIMSEMDVDEMNWSISTYQLDESCWLLEYRTGEKVIVSESEYEKWYKRGLVCESHYFDRQTCITRNPDAKIIPDD